MKSASLLAAGLLACLTSAATLKNPFQGRCDKGPFVIVARGTGEPSGPGRMGIVAKDIAEAVPGTTVLVLEYPAGDDYFPSAAQGMLALQRMIHQYREACPNAALILLGYSQGAQVVNDVLCGKFLGPLYNVTAPLDSDSFQIILAAVTFGDPSHIPGVPWDFGSSQRAGWFPRWNTTGCTPYAEKMRTYCDAGDRYCDNGDSPDAHLGYFDKYVDDAVDFVLDRLDEQQMTPMRHNTTVSLTNSSQAVQGFNRCGNGHRSGWDLNPCCVSSAAQVTGSLMALVALGVTGLVFAF